MMQDEDLKREATQWVRANASVKGKANLTIKDFHRYLNNDLPKVQIPDFPRKSLLLSWKIRNLERQQLRVFCMSWVLSVATLLDNQCI